MTSTENAVTTDAAAAAQSADLWVQRTGTRTYTGRNSRGAVVSIGPIENDGSFTPGELLKIALAACTGLTTDAVLARRLGDDFDATITVEGAKDVDADRYPAITENLLVDVAGLSPAELKRLLTIVHRSVEEHCTVGRTVSTGTEVTLQVNGDVAH
ncbi:OsmC family protein [Nakamurella deserti]|uniref:OsmC family protein n=1 Tax=Nakamurella deserti TaxID=2164074 RepID=UPI000DBE147D|nr:OsmC family protein [Nakamurella deserti]